MSRAELTDAADHSPQRSESFMIQTLIVLAGGVAVLALVAFVRKVRVSQVPDRLSPEVLTRINTEYAELPQ
jgi:hypothetical protein